MYENIYRTIQGILRSEMPQNDAGEVLCARQIVKGWYFGDRALITNTPAIVVEAGDDSPSPNVASGFKDAFTLTISAWVRGDLQENSEVLALEMARLIADVLRSHWLTWVVDVCPLCGKLPLTPLHYTDEHADLLAPFIQTAQDNWSSQWFETHDTSEALPTRPDSAVAVAALAGLWLAVENGDTVVGLTTAQHQNILDGQRDGTKPVRILTAVHLTRVKPVTQTLNQKLHLGGEFSLSLTEFTRPSALGPDNVVRVAI